MKILDHEFSWLVIITLALVIVAILVTGGTMSH